MTPPGRDRAFVRALRAAWHLENQERFRGALNRVSFSLIEGRQHLGQWVRRDRAIRVSRPFVEQRPWPEVIEVLKHEMAHQYVDEVLGVHDETSHGPAFKRVCAQFGIDAAASGIPTPSTEDEPKVVRKVRRLLALATSDNPHEAEAAMNTAQRLMLEYNLDQSDLDGRRYGWRLLGKPRSRIPGHERVLAGILARHFFVDAIWLNAYLGDDKWGRVLEICGTAENLDMADWVHQFLLDTSERLWAAHKKAQGIPGNKHRRRFLTGVMSGFHTKLVQQTSELAETGLVWVGDPGRESYTAQRHPRLRSARRSRVRVDQAFHDGKAAGHKIVLKRPIGTGPAGNSRPAQLQARSNRTE